MQLLSMRNKSFIDQVHTSGQTSLYIAEQKMGKKQPAKKAVVVVRRSSTQLYREPAATTSTSQLPVVVELEADDIPRSFTNVLHEILANDDEVVVGSPYDVKEQEAKAVTDLEQGIGDDSGVTPTRGTTRRWAYKNVLGVSLSFFFVFTAFLGIQNLQSSVNSSGGLGLASLAVIYGAFTISGFFTPVFLKIFGTRNSLLAGFICHLIYVSANFYPGWFTLIPASVLLGLASAPIWAAGSSHIAKVAVALSSETQTETAHLIGMFTGVFYFFFQMAQVPGNLASSLIFFPYDGSLNASVSDELALTNDSMEESQCRLLESGGGIDLKYLYILASVYLLFISLGILFLLAMVNKLEAHDKDKLKEFKNSFVDLFRVLVDYKMVLIAPISVFNGMEMSFAFGTFTQVFISECFGAYMVGFTLIVLGLTSAIMSMFWGKVMKCIPRFCIFIMGGTINITSLVFILLWTPVPSYLIIFVFAVSWGIADGVWNTVTASLVGILFSSQSDMAYSSQRIWQAVGFTIGFISAEFLRLSSQIWVMLGTVVLAVLCSIVVELKTQPLPCYNKQVESPVTDSNTSEEKVADTTENHKL